MVELLIRKLVKNSVIIPGDAELYQYGLDLLIKKILHLLIILIFGIISKKFTCTIAFLITYAGIREYAGGYHAKTSKGCYFCTYMVTSLSILLFYIFEHIVLLGLYIILIFCAVLIGHLAPQETLNRPLDMQELIIYRRKTRKCLIVGAIICLLFFRKKAIVDGILCAWILETIMLLLVRVDVRHR